VIEEFFFYGGVVEEFIQCYDRTGENTCACILSNSVVFISSLNTVL